MKEKFLKNKKNHKLSNMKLSEHEVAKISGGDGEYEGNQGPMLGDWGDDVWVKKKSDVKWRYNVGDRVEVYWSKYAHVTTMRATIIAKGIYDDGGLPSQYTACYTVKYDSYKFLVGYIGKKILESRIQSK